MVYKFMWTTTKFRITVSYILQRYLWKEKQDKYLIMPYVK